MKCAVLPDTNVVAAASVHAKSDVLDIVVSEPHHDESRLLLDAFLDPGSDGWCVASPTVIGEVYRVTRRAATQATHRAFTKQCVKKGGVWVSEMGRIVEHCVNESFRLVSSMAKYDLHPFSVEAKLVEVDKMTEDIKKRYRDTALETAFGSPNGVPGSPGGSVGSGAEQAAAGFGQDDASQYERFLRREPTGNTMDKRILAEAVAIRDGISGKAERLCIASNDMGIFAPLRLRGGRESGPIVDMIRDRFGIECGLPRTIRTLCTGAHGS